MGNQTPGQTTLAARNIPLGLLKLLIAIVFAVGAYYFVSYVTTEIADTGAGAASGTTSEKGHRIPGGVQDFEKAVQGMKETNELLVNWAIILLGGTIGIAIMAKGAKIQDRNWGLILIPPTWVLLGASLYHGSRFKGGLTYQLAKGQYVFRDLNTHLFLQMEFFKYSIIALVVLATWYLFFRFSQWEDRSGKGE